MRQFDVIAVIKDFPEYGLVRGQKGTILEVYDEQNFEVEFCDSVGITIF